MADLQLGNIKPAGADNVVVDSKYVKGGYVVAATLKELFPESNDEIKASLKGENGQNIIAGSLCFCKENNKFYQYNGTNWVEKEFGTTTEATTSEAGLMSASDKQKLDGIADGAEVNVQADWTETNTSSDAYIKNKPALKTVATSGQVKDIYQDDDTVIVLECGDAEDQTSTPIVISDPKRYIRIQGILNNASELPDPSTLNDFTKAYLVGTESPYSLYIQVVESTTGWADVGKFNANSAGTGEMPTFELSAGTVPVWNGTTFADGIALEDIVTKADTPAAEATRVTVNGQYQDTWDANTKVDKMTVTSGYARAYMEDTNGPSSLEVVPGEAKPWTIAERSTDGTIYTGSPTENGHATTKKYVDDAVANRLSTVQQSLTGDTPYVDVNLGLSEETMKRFFKDSFMVGTTHYTNGGIVGPSNQWVSLPQTTGVMATEDYVTQQLNGYATKTDIEGYPTKQFLADYYVPVLKMANYVTHPQLDTVNSTINNTINSKISKINNANANYYEIAAGGKFTIHRSGMYIILSSGSGKLSVYRPDKTDAVISDADSLLMMTVPYSTSQNGPLFVAMGATIGSSLFNADSIQVELQDGSYVTCNTKFYVGEIAFKKIT